jgi:hypothetical protein
MASNKIKCIGVKMKNPPEYKEDFFLKKCGEILAVSATGAGTSYRFDFHIKSLFP